MLAEALILSGMAMAVAGSSRPCSGGDHEIMHAIDQLYPGTASHGELAGVGALFCAYLRGDLGQAELIAACLRRHRLPRSPTTWGCRSAEFAKAVSMRARHPAGPVHDPGAPQPVGGGDGRASGGVCPGLRWLSCGRRASRRR